MSSDPMSLQSDKTFPLDDVAISISGVGKVYATDGKPFDRLKSILFASLLGDKASKGAASEFRALSDVSIDIRKGETVGIVGRNGSGKSTLLQIICGTLRPSEGSVAVNGRVAALLELGSGFNPEFTGRENVFMNGAILGLQEHEIVAKFESIHAFSEIGDFIDQPVKTYSSGMLVRLAFAVIAHVDADILIIDEALSVGDAFFVQKCMRFLRKFMETGTVLFVSHDTGAVVNLCDRAIWLEAGTVVAHGNPKEISEAYLAKQYGSGPQSNAKPKMATLPGKKADQQSSHGISAPRDMRADLLNASPFRNDIELFAFDESATGFGTGGVQLDHVQMKDNAGSTLSWIIGGEVVHLVITATSSVHLTNPIVGFLVRDRLGQPLFGDNTYLALMDEAPQIDAGQTFNAQFTFQMPIMPQGNYTVSVAVANGTQSEHTLHSWLHDVLSFKSHSTSVTTGLIGIPMLDIQIEPVEA